MNFTKFSTQDILYKVYEQLFSKKKGITNDPVTITPNVFNLPSSDNSNFLLGMEYEKHGKYEKICYTYFIPLNYYNFILTVFKSVFPKEVVSPQDLLLYAFYWSSQPTRLNIDQ